MKKKTNRNRKPNQAAIDAAIDSYLDNLWPKNPDGTPLVLPEPEIDPEWEARMAARAKYSAELDERRAKGEKISPFLCY
jgi:hypothetical protein